MTALRKSAEVVRLHGVRIDLEDVGRAVRLMQEEIFRCGRTYNQIADDGGIHPTTVMKIAHGETTRPTVNTMLCILRSLGAKVIVEF
jgi:hypothetical protein